MSNKTESNWFSGYNFIGKIPKKAVIDCSHAGRCDDDVKYWVNKLNFVAPLELGIKYIRGCGLVEFEGDQARVNEYVFWLFCCELKEQANSGEHSPLTLFTLFDYCFIVARAYVCARACL
jgi:hypothetical protein